MMTIKEAIKSGLLSDLIGIISNREQIISELEKVLNLMEQNTNRINEEQILQYSIIYNAIQYFKVMTDNEAYNIKKRIQMQTK